MTNDNLHINVRLPAGRRGTVIKTYKPHDGMPVYGIRADDNGQIMKMVEIAEGELIRQEDFDRLNTVVRGIRDGTIKPTKVTNWTADQYCEWLLGES